MLAQVINPGEAARLLLNDLKRDLPSVAAILDDAIHSSRVRELLGEMLIIESGVHFDSGTTLALLLNWIIDSKLAKIPVAISNQLSALAARVFDYPEIAAHALSSEMGRRRRGHGKDDRMSPADRDQIISNALRRRGSEDRPIVVADLAKELDITPNRARRILSDNDWPGRPSKEK
jgi:hypothetical protein